MPDLSSDLQVAVIDARARNSPLSIQGSGSKAFYGRATQASILDTSGHSGILNYEPSEVVITARCGTRLSDIEATLAEKGQMLGFEAPRFGPDSTLGGVIASGLSGPRRPFSGSVRDFVLGCRLINGRGEILSFGGETMKNVAGYDLSRLMAGSLGTLGVLLEVSLKVIPRPPSELTLRFELVASRAIEQMNRWMGLSLPISALAWHRGICSMRLSGGEKSLNAARRATGGELLPGHEAFWDALRDHKLEFFRTPGTLWRWSLASATPPPAITGDWFYDWGGAQRWLVSPDPEFSLFETAAQNSGHATFFRGQISRDRVFQPLSPSLLGIHQRIKIAFDPERVFNPGRMYSEI